MPDFKVVIGLKSGKCKQIEVKDPESRIFLGKKIGDKVPGDAIKLAGWEFEVAGGSDNAGFPMRRDVQGIGRKKILAVSGVGIKRLGRGIRQRKTVAGNTIYPGIVQVNLKTVKEGSVKIEVEEKPKEGKAAEKKEEKPEPKEEKKAEKPKEEKKKEEKKPEAKAAERKGEKKPELKEEKKQEKPKEEEKKPEKAEKKEEKAGAREEKKQENPKEEKKEEKKPEAKAAEKREEKKPEKAEKKEEKK